MKIPKTAADVLDDHVVFDRAKRGGPSRTARSTLAIELRPGSVSRRSVRLLPNRANLVSSPPWRHPTTRRSGILSCSRER